MLQLLPQENILSINSVKVNDSVEYINSYIDSNDCSVLKIDISSLNFIDAVNVSTMGSTKHYIKYPDGKIEWMISSDLTKECCERLSLGNAKFVLV